MEPSPPSTDAPRTGLDAGSPPAWQGSWRIDLGSFEPMATGLVDARALAPIDVAPIAGRLPRRARVLVVLDRRPIGFVIVPVHDGVVRAPDLETAIVELVADGVPGRPLHRVPRTVAELCEALSPRPLGEAAGRERVSIVVPTRDRPASLERLLRSIAAVRYRDYEVIVVDNASRTAETREVVERFAGVDPRVRYVHEPRPGLSRTRNRGASVARHEILAFTDDDTVVTPFWLDAALDALAEQPDAGAVTGFVPSLRLDNAVQARFDQVARWSSRFEPARWTRDGGPRANPAHPFAAGAVGAGATYIVRRDVFERVGGFDEALGAGTLTHGGEDLDYFVRLLLAGVPIAYEPGLVVWHDNRDTDEAYRRQVWGWGVGLSAYITKMAVHPATRGALWRRIPAGVRHAWTLRGNASTGSAPAGPTPVRSAPTSDGSSGAARLAMVRVAAWGYGPVAYARSRRAAGATAGESNG